MNFKSNPCLDSAYCDYNIDIFTKNLYFYVCERCDSWELEIVDDEENIEEVDDDEVIEATVLEDLENPDVIFNQASTIFDE